MAATRGAGRVATRSTTTTKKKSTSRRTSVGGSHSTGKKTSSRPSGAGSSASQSRRTTTTTRPSGAGSSAAQSRGTTPPASGGSSRSSRSSPTYLPTILQPSTPPPAPSGPTGRGGGGPTRYGVTPGTAAPLPPNALQQGIDSLYGMSTTPPQYLVPPGTSAAQNPLGRQIMGGIVSPPLSPDSPGSSPLSTTAGALRDAWNYIPSFPSVPSVDRGPVRGAMGQVLPPTLPVSGLPDMPPRGAYGQLNPGVEALQDAATRVARGQSAAPVNQAMDVIPPAGRKQWWQGEVTVPATAGRGQARGTEAARLEGLADAYDQGVVPPVIENIPGTQPERKARYDIPWQVLGFEDKEEGYDWAKEFQQAEGFWPWEGPLTEEQNLGNNLANWYNRGAAAPEVPYEEQYPFADPWNLYGGYEEEPYYEGGWGGGGGGWGGWGGGGYGGGGGSGYGGSPQDWWWYANQASGV